MGTRERRAREKEQRRKQILGAARRLFLSQGYDATTMPAVAAAAELAPGTLYLYFPGKEALYVELLNEGYDILLARLRGAVPEQGAPRRQAEALIDAFMQFALDYPDYFDVIFFVLQRERRAVRGVSHRQRLMEGIAAREDGCRRMASEILARIRPKESPAERELRVEAIWSMLAGVVLYFGSEPAALRTVFGAARELILRGVFGRE